MCSRPFSYVPAAQGVGPWLAHITLPAVALSFDVVADVARQLRTSLIAAYRENYVTGAVVRGSVRGGSSSAMCCATDSARHSPPSA